MRTHRRTLSLSLTALVLSVAGCSSGAGQESDGYRIAFLGLAAQNSYSQATFAAAEQVITEAGGSTTFFDGQWKSDVQYNQLLDIATSQNFDGVLVMANDGASLVPAATRVIDSGLELIAVEFPIGPNPTDLSPQIDGITATVGYDAHAEAVTQAERVVEVCKDKSPCNVAWLMGDRTTLFDKIRWDAINATLDKHPNVDVVTAIDTHWNRDEGLAAGRTILAANAENLDVITGPDIGLMGATDALRTAGALDRYTLIGFGTTVDGIEQVKNGTWDSSTGVHQPADEGALAATMMLDALQGKTVPESVDMIDESPIGDVATTQSLEGDPSFTGQWN